MRSAMLQMNKLLAPSPTIEGMRHRLRNGAAPEQFRSPVMSRALKVLSARRIIRHFWRARHMGARLREQPERPAPDRNFGVDRQRERPYIRPEDLDI